MSQAKLTSYFAKKRHALSAVVKKDRSVVFDSPSDRSRSKRKLAELLTPKSITESDVISKKKCKLDDDRRSNGLCVKPNIVTSQPAKVNVFECKEDPNVRPSPSKHKETSDDNREIQKDSTEKLVPDEIPIAVDDSKAEENSTPVALIQTEAKNALQATKSTVEKMLRSHKAFDSVSYSIPRPVSPLPPSPERTPVKSLPSVSNGNGVLSDKKPPIAELANRMEKCNTIRDLRKQLLELRSLRSAQKETVITAPETSVKNEVKKEPEVVPAYQRFHNLALPPSALLSLPYKYKMLEEMFRASETIASMLHNRHEKCTFQKIKSGVQQMTRKNFELKHLAQIKKIFENAYDFQQEKAVRRGQDGTTEYELVVTPKLDDKEDGERRKPVRPHMSASVLLERRNFFHDRLIDLTKDHHEAYVLRLNPPVVVDKEKLVRWHPGFDVDGVPDIPIAPLPEAPNVQCMTAKDVFRETKGIHDKRIEEALKTVAQKYQPVAEVPDKEAGKSKPSILSGLKGIPIELLNKIRAREAVMMEKKLVRNPEIDQKLIMLSRLPELARIIRNYFITERKAAIPLLDVIVKLTESTTRGITSANVEEHVRYLSSITPKWLAIIPLKKGIYLKINKDLDIKTVAEEISKHKDKLIS